MTQEQRFNPQGKIHLHTQFADYTDNELAVTSCGLLCGK